MFEEVNVAINYVSEQVNVAINYVSDTEHVKHVTVSNYRVLAKLCWKILSKL